MEILVEKQEGKIIISLVGRLDTVTSQELAAKVPLEEREGLDVIFDFKDLEYVSSAGLRTLLVFKKDAQKDGKELSIINANAVIKEIFSVTGFDKILKVS